MSKAWPLVKLGEVIRQRKEFITIDDTQEYMRCRVQLHAKGIVLRDRVTGSEIKTKQQQVCQAGEFLVAEIDAKVGGYGIVPDELENSIVSSHYFLFTLDHSQLNTKFLDYYSQTPAFREQVNAKGSTNYAAIRPHEVLNYTIPLPPLAEQQRIVAKIERLAGKIEEASKLRQQLTLNSELLLASHANTILSSDEIIKWPFYMLGDISEVKSGVTLGRYLVGQTVRLPYLRVANVQDGHLDLSVIKEIEVLENEVDKWKLKFGDLLLTEGGDWDKLGRGTIWKDQIPNCIHQNHIFRVRANPNEFYPEYIAAIISSPAGKKYFQTASKQTTNLASINQRQLKAFPVAKPPLPVQKKILTKLEHIRLKTKHLKSIQSQTTAELDAMLPSILDQAFKGEL